MATKTKWFFFWLISGSFLAGILAVCFVVSAVNWLGSETFCSTGCHTMNGVAYAWKQGSHARTPSGKTADCSDCHLYNASENTLGPLGYISLLGHKIVAASHSAYGQVIGHFATPTQWVEQRPGIEAQEKQWFVDAYIDANHAYPPLDEAWVFPVAATTSASPMPPQNLTPEQLKKDALPWTPSSVSSASTSAAQNAPVNQSKDVQQIANELNQKITQPITPNAQNASPASAPKAQATTTASTPAKSTAQ